MRGGRVRQRVEATDGTADAVETAIEEHADRVRPAPHNLGHVDIE